MAADAASRHPVGISEVSLCSSKSILSLQDEAEELFMAGISTEVTNVTSISWQDIESATKSDPVLSELVTAIENEFIGEYKLSVL